MEIVDQRSCLSLNLKEVHAGKFNETQLRWSTISKEAYPIQDCKIGPVGCIEFESMSLTVVIPAYKEGLNLKELVTRIYKSFDGSKTLEKSKLEVIVVDDNSNVSKMQTGGSPLWGAM